LIPAHPPPSFGLPCVQLKLAGPFTITVVTLPLLPLLPLLLLLLPPLLLRLL
jgi:hypothetical protein